MRDRCRKRLRIFWSDCRDVTEEDIERWTKVRSNTYTVCSCYMCGNPRRKKGGMGYHEKTLAERRSALDFEDQLEEYQDEMENRIRLKRKV